MKMAYVLLCLSFISSSAFADHTQVITSTHKSYPGGKLNGYVMIEREMVDMAASICAQAGEVLINISNINIQVIGNFAPEPNGHEIRAHTYPDIVYSALVSCDESRPLPVPFVSTLDKNQ